MNKSWVWVLIVVVILAAGGYYLYTNMQSQTVTQEITPAPETTNQASPSSDNAMSKTFVLDEQNESSESGTAVLTEENGKVTVTLSMTGAPETVPQPAHIHAGACPAVGEVEYPLTNVVNGSSETIIEATLEQLASLMPLAINVHKSAAEAKVYVSCGDLSL